MADTYDVLVLDDVKDLLQVDTVNHDTDLQLVITAVSRKLDRLCGQIVRRTVTGETHNGGRSWIRLGNDRASTITTVTEYVQTTGTVLTAETNATKPAAAYLVDDLGAGVVLLRRRAAGNDCRFAPGRRNIVVDYTYGRYDDTASVDDLFVEAARLMVTHLFKAAGPSWHTSRDFFDETIESAVQMVPRFGVPNVVRDLLSDELRVPPVA